MILSLKPLPQDTHTEWGSSAIASHRRPELTAT